MANTDIKRGERGRRERGTDGGGGRKRSKEKLPTLRERHRKKERKKGQKRHNDKDNFF